MKLKKITVKWVDSSRNNQGWEWEEDAINDPIVVCTTTGYLLHEARDRLVIVSGYSDRGQVQGRHTIPKSAIRSRK